MNGYDRRIDHGRGDGSHGGGTATDPGKRTLTAGLGPGPARDTHRDVLDRLDTNLRVTSVATEDLEGAIAELDFDSATLRRGFLDDRVRSLDNLSSQVEEAAGREDLAARVADLEARVPATKARAQAALARAPEPGPDDHSFSFAALGMDEAPERAARRERWLAKIGANANSSAGPSAARPVPDPVRGRVERATGADLSGVTVRTGSTAAAVADAHDARAVAVGQTIHVGAGEDLHGVDGEHLLAHEVAHTVQGKNDGADAPRAAAKSRSTTPTDSPAEIEADRFADTLATGGTPPPLTASLDGAIARTPHASTKHRDKSDTSQQGGANQHGAPLDGGSTKPAPLALSTEALSFGTVRVGEETAPQSVIVTNAGSDPVDIENVAAYPPAPAFPSYGALGGALAPGDAADLRFSFRPSEPGDQRATYHVVTDGGVTSARIQVEGAAVPTSFDNGPLANRASLSVGAAEQLDNHERLGAQSLATRKSIAGADHAGVDDLNTLEWVAAERGVNLPAPEEGAGYLEHAGYEFTSDPVHMRYVLERVINDHGLKGAADIIVALGQVKYEWDEADGATINRSRRDAMAKRQEIPALAGRIYGELDGEATQLIPDFEAAGMAEIRRSLAASEGSVRGSIAQYGLVWNDLFEKLLGPQILSDEPTPVQIIGETLETALRIAFGEKPKVAATNNKALGALTSSARALQQAHSQTNLAMDNEGRTLDAVARDPKYAPIVQAYIQDVTKDGDYDIEVDESPADEGERFAESMFRDDLSSAAAGDKAAQAKVGGPVDPKLQEAQEDVRGAENEEELLTTGLEAEHPILAAFRGDLDSLTAGTNDEVAQRLAIKSIETFANIRKVRSGLDRGKYSVWKLPRIIEATRPHVLVAPGTWRDRVISDHVKEVSDDEAWVNFALGALAVGLSIVAAIPTGGSSLAVAAGVAADAGAIGIDVYMAYDAVESYEYQRAAAHTDFDPFKAIADREPSLANVIMSVAAAGVGLSSAVGIIRRAKGLEGLVRRALEGDVEALARARVVRDELNLSASQSGIGSRLGDDVVAEATSGGTLEDVATQTGTTSDAAATDAASSTTAQSTAPTQEPVGTDPATTKAGQQTVTKGVPHWTVEGAKDVPSVRGGAFNRWFNALSPEDLEALWARKDIREVIEDRLRAPGGLHEWHLVSRTPTFKRWGLTAEDIKDLRTKIEEVIFKNPAGRHGLEGSTTAHNEMLKIIDGSLNYDDFVRRLRNWAHYRLEGGADNLPGRLAPGE